MLSGTRVSMEKMRSSWTVGLGAFLSSYEVEEDSVTLAHPADEVEEAVQRRLVPLNQVLQQIR
jgi:hypothetical protein